MHPLDDVAAQALDALDGPDRRALGSHLAGCPSCRAELDALRSTAARLVRPATPPPMVWSRIAATLPADADPRRLGHPTRGVGPGAADAGPGGDGLARGGRGGAAGFPAGSFPRAAGGPDLAGARSGAGAGEPVPLPGRRRSSPRRPAGLLLAAAAAIAVVAGAVGFVSGRAGGPSSEPGVPALAEAALADPGNARAALTDAAGREVARVVVGHAAGEGYVVLDGLDPLPDDLTYQLWRFDGPTPVSVGVLGDGTTATLAVPLPPTPQDAPARLAITAESAPGAATPDGPLVAQGLLPPGS